MKIERINENQIRCTLNRADLADRDLRLSELAYGTDKAKSLFRDMMQQASYELGFEAEDIPLMIEAIPVNQDCLILVITKVEDPDELDTRFSKFSKPISIDMDETQDESDESLDDSFEDTNAQFSDLANTASSDESSSKKPHETIFDLLNEIDNGLEELAARKEATRQGKEKSNTSINSDSKSSSNLYRVFTFHTLSEVIKASSVLAPQYHGRNTLYKNSKTEEYQLVIYQGNTSTESFVNACSLLSEFGKREQGTYASISYLEEHFQPIIKDNAIQVLANL